MRWRVALAGLALVLVGAPPASAAEREVVTNLEAWYSSLPSLTPRPAGRLYVGVTAGTEDSRAYLALDLGPLGDVTPTAGQLRLPIDAAASSSPASALVDVCLAGSPGLEVEGSTEPPPTVDCSAAVRATVSATALTADLRPFLAALRTSGLALVPVGGGVGTWQVAISGRAQPTRITARLTVPDPPPAAEPTPQPPTTATTAPPSRFTNVDVGFTDRPPSGMPAAPTQAAVPDPVPVLGPSAPDRVLVSPAVSSGDAARYADSLAFSIPLVLLGFGLFTGRALVAPIRRPLDRRPPNGPR